MKPIEWVGSSRKDLQELPGEVRLEIGHALHLVQLGERPPGAKPLKGFKGASVLELREDFDTDTYRLVYTVKYEEAIYVLHSFQKKSTQGIKTSRQDIEMIHARLKVAKELHQQWLKKSS